MEEDIFYDFFLLLLVVHILAKVFQDKPVGYAITVLAVLVQFNKNNVLNLPSLHNFNLLLICLLTH